MKLFLDMPDRRERAPESADIMVAIGVNGKWNSAYRITGVHRVNRRDPNAPRRYTMQVHKCDIVGDAKELRAVLEATGSRLITFYWYPRDKKRRTFETQLSDGIRRQALPSTCLR